MTTYKTYKLITSAQIHDKIQVTKYKSEKTGLSIILADVEGPVVNGYFTLATETHDDDGLPHTLEHLIFLGSELYPYKGMLDLLANRCLASGTNAWTDTDHTSYMMTTVGKGGFLTLLPIYLDHILYPTLNNSGFITEVHHISETGEDGGVVYCEMQGEENSAENRTHVQIVRSCYPNSGYSSETGGSLHNLRTSTTNEKVRKFHAQFYRPENLAIIIVGHVTIEEIYKILEPFEERVLTKMDKSEFKKPWKTPISPIKESKNIKIFYPADEEDYGLVSVAWRGPNCSFENLQLSACSILLRYLSDTSVSPLQRDCVEIDDPLCSSIPFDISENLESLIGFTFQNVPINKTDLVYMTLETVLHNIVSGLEKIDMKRIRNIIDRKILEFFNNLESNPHDAIAFWVIGDFLYGNTNEDFEMRLNNNTQLEYLKKMDDLYWIGLIKKYMIDGKHVVVSCKSSISEQKRMSKKETERIANQRADLGVNGLHKKGEELAEAIVFNNKLPPKEIYDNIPLPSICDIKYHSIEVYKSGETNKILPGFDFNKLPVYVEAIDIKTNFVYFTLSFNTHYLQTELRSYLLLYLELITKSPIWKNGKLMPYEEVVAALETDTLALDTRLGLESRTPFSCGPYPHSAILSLQVEPKKYEIGINWIVNLLHNTEFTIDRITICITKIINTVSQVKRKGDSICHDLIKAMHFIADGNLQVNSVLQQYSFLTKLSKKLKSNPTETAAIIIRNLNIIRLHITMAKNVSVHIGCDWTKMNKMGIDLLKPWFNVVRSNDNVTVEKSLEVIPDWKLMCPIIKNKFKDGAIIGLSCVESTYLYHCVPSIIDFMDPDLPSLLLFLQYITQLEGPLWRHIRGQGLAYGYNITPRPHQGLLYFTLYQATNVVAAFKEAKTVTEAQLKDDAIWDTILLVSAKNSLIYEIVEREKSIGDLVSQAVLTSFKGVDINYNRWMVEKVNKVTVPELISIGKKHMQLLFSPNAKTAIVCHPSKQNEIAKQFLTLFQRDLSIDTLESSALGGVDSECCDGDDDIEDDEDTINYSINEIK